MNVFESQLSLRALDARTPRCVRIFRALPRAFPPPCAENRTTRALRSTQEEAVHCFCVPYLFPLFHYLKNYLCFALFCFSSPARLLQRHPVPETTQATKTQGAHSLLVFSSSLRLLYGIGWSFFRLDLLFSWTRTLSVPRFKTDVFIESRRSSGGFCPVSYTITPKHQYRDDAKVHMATFNIDISNFCVLSAVMKTYLVTRSTIIFKSTFSRVSRRNCQVKGSFK